VFIGAEIVIVTIRAYAAARIEKREGRNDYTQPVNTKSYSAMSGDRTVSYELRIQ
jgi:hypothetical protein